MNSADEKGTQIVGTLGGEQAARNGGPNRRRRHSEAAGCLGKTCRHTSGRRGRELARAPLPRGGGGPIRDAGSFSARVERAIDWRMREMRAELIDCHDCERPVSFSALSCPHCGSTEPAGPYAFNKKEARRFRVEQRNDHMLVITTVACSCAGALYGILLSSSTFVAIMAGVGYGVVGLLIGVPIAFAINLTRGLLR